MVRLREMASSLACHLFAEEDPDQVAELSSTYWPIWRCLQRVWNADIGWRAAWWRHVALLSKRLADLRTAQSHNASGDQSLNFASAIYAAAGMPAPDDSDAAKYCSRGREPKIYADLVATRWSTGEAAQLSAINMATIALKENPDLVEYRFRDLDWLTQLDTFSATEEHPVLALSFLPKIEDWLGTAELEFFGEPHEAADWEIMTRTHDGQFLRAPVLEGVELEPYILRTDLFVSRAKKVRFGL